ncbi:MAG: ABC transporter ATP-binding protein [Bacteroidales bacterium]
MDWILRADSLVKKFGDVVAVNGISFEVRKGEIFGFLGPNGAGKTTSIKMMSGLLKPDSGSVSINTSDNRRSIGICPQHIVVWENLSCMEQVVYMGRMYDLPVSVAEQKGHELLDAMGLLPVKDRLAKKLSGGMQRRLNIALALIHSPELVFLDEPQAGLDPQSRVLVREYIRSIRETTTVILTTHDMEEAEKLSDRVCIIDAGRLLTLGTPADLTSGTGSDDLVEISITGDAEKDLFPFINERLIREFSRKETIYTLSSPEPVLLAESLLQTAREKNLGINSLQMRKKSLEDIFISLTGRSLRE